MSSGKKLSWFISGTYPGADRLDRRDRPVGGSVKRHDDVAPPELAEVFGPPQRLDGQPRGARNRSRQTDPRRVGDEN